MSVIFSQPTQALKCPSLEWRNKFWLRLLSIRQNRLDPLEALPIKRVLSKPHPISICSFS